MENYPIYENLLSVYDSDRPRIPLKPIGLIIHETADPNATDEQEVEYFKTHDAHASAHYFVDYDSITRDIPENEMAYHAGPIANSLYLSMELCHFDDPVKFAEVWKRGVWLAAYICFRYKWDPKTCIHSHDWVSKTYHQTDHTDPVEYFAKHGKSFDDFVNDVVKVLAEMKDPSTYPLPDKVLKYDPYHYSSDVKLLQRALNAVNFGYHAITADGYFGPATRDALKAFQRYVHITDDGIYGPQTKQKLKEALQK